MHQFVLLLILMAAGLAGAHGLPAAAGTPAARFWEQALPGSPMPEAIAELVQRGIDRSPLKEHHAAPYFLPSACFGYEYKISICGNKGPPMPTQPKPPPAVLTEEEEAVTGLFFREAQVRTGSVMAVSMPPAAVQAVLPRDVAEKVPFAKAADVLSTFHIPTHSDEAVKVRDTLRGCRAPALAGEQKACATSLEGTVRAATRMLGTAATTHGKVWAAASALPRDGLQRQAYVVSAVTALDGDSHVACHDEPFPYAVFQCHMTGKATTKAFMITLSGGSQAVAMAALCHRDTSNWNPAHPAFEMLHAKPGGEPVCHFMPYANLVFGMKVEVPY